MVGGISMHLKHSTARAQNRKILGLAGTLRISKTLTKKLTERPTSATSRFNPNPLRLCPNSTRTDRFQVHCTIFRSRDQRALPMMTVARNLTRRERPIAVGAFIPRLGLTPLACVLACAAWGHPLHAARTKGEGIVIWRLKKLQSSRAAPAGSALVTAKTFTDKGWDITIVDWDKAELGNCGGTPAGRLALGL